MRKLSILRFKTFAITFVMLVFFFPAFSQKTIRGKIIDTITNSPIHGATVRAIGTKVSTSSNADGFFIISVDSIVSEIQISQIAYTTEVVKINDDDIFLSVFMDKGNRVIDAVDISQKKKYNRKNPATAIIDLVIQNKKFNKLTKKDSLFFEQYEKVKFGFVNPQSTFSKKLGDMSFFFKNIDSTLIDGKRTLALFMQESFSENYVKQDPARTKKIIIAEQKTEYDPRYINNHNIEAYLDYILQPVDVYDESIFFVNKLFLSPIADNAKLYYKFFIADTIRNGSEYNIRLRFEPFNKADLLFTGELIISMDGRYAVKHASMSVGKEANLSWVNNLQLQLSYFKNEEGIMLQDSSRVLAQFGGTKSDVLFGERRAVNLNYKFNYPITKELFSGAPVEINLRTNTQLGELRPIPLNRAEEFTYINVQKISQLKSFRTIASIGYLLSQGYYSAGKFELGPLEYLFHRNNIEGSRVRIGGRTTPYFSKKVYLQGYVAYGFEDQDIKYYLNSAFSLNGKSVAEFPAHYLEATVQHDVFNPGRSIGFFKGDSFFRSFGSNRPTKWLNTDAYRLGHLIEFGNHVSIKTSFTHQRRSPLGDLRFIKSDNSFLGVENLNTNDVQIVLRWAPFEKFYYRNLERRTIVEKHPVFNIQYNKGLGGFWGSNHSYDALRLSISKRFFMNQLGFGDVTVSTGKIWGTLPYVLLEIPNVQDESDRHAISYERTNSMEFVADQFVKFSYDHKFNGFILNKIPIIKRLKLRETMGVKMFYGELSNKNNPYLSNDVFNFDIDKNGVPTTYVLGSTPYWEGYVGLDNIFKIFKVEYYKRFNYLNLPNVQDQGFMKNLRFSIKFDF